MYISIFLDSEQSVIFIGIIVGLSFVAVLLASISLILIKKSKNKKSHLTHFEKSNSFQANIYTQNTFCKVRFHSKLTRLQLEFTPSGPKFPPGINGPPVRIGPRFSNFCWSWSGPVPGFENVLGSGPFRSQVSKFFLVLIRAGPRI